LEYPLTSTVSLNFISYMLPLRLDAFESISYHSGVPEFQPVNATTQFYANPGRPAGTSPSGMRLPFVLLFSSQPDSLDERVPVPGLLAGRVLRVTAA
jgi:hypothetical protein